MAKPGPKPKLTDEVKIRIVEALERGLSQADALLALGIAKTTYHDAMRADEHFRTRIKGAAARGKDYHLCRVWNAEERWQASAWFLERKYGSEFGQKVKLDVEGEIVTRLVEEIVEAPAGVLTGVSSDGQAAADRNGQAAAAPGAGRLPPQ